MLKYFNGNLHVLNGYFIVFFDFQMGLLLRSQWPEFRTVTVFKVLIQGLLVVKGLVLDHIYLRGCQSLKRNYIICRTVIFKGILTKFITFLEPTVPPFTVSSHSENLIQ